jgi:PAS domain S-box-containing protein
MGLHEFTKELSIRMDIADEADNRMSFKLDADKACVYISENFLRFFGYTPNDILGSDWEFCIDEKHRRIVRTKWKEAFKFHKPYRNDQIIVDSDAKRHLCLVRRIPRENKDDELTGFFGTVEVLESLDE